MNPVFDSTADVYDRWYDTPEGQTIFNAEMKCLQSLRGEAFEAWLEVGVGTGRFANALGIPKGIDPSPHMLEIAAKRGIEVHAGNAEALPFPDESFEGILMALTLCFVANARQAVEECGRVLRPEGLLLLGIVPADSPWGQSYRTKASMGHTVYTHAHFRTVAETVKPAQDAGFAMIDAASTLFWKPGETPKAMPRLEQGIVPEAGFVGLLFTLDRSLK